MKIGFKEFIERAFAKRNAPDEDAQIPLATRKRRRLNTASREARIRKGTRRFYEQQRQQRFQQDTVRAQMAVLEAGRDANPAMYDNVLHAMWAKYGDQFKLEVQA